MSRATALDKATLAAPAVTDDGPDVRDFEPVWLLIPNDQALPLLDAWCAIRGPGRNGGYPLAGLGQQLDTYVRDLRRQLRLRRKVTEAKRHFKAEGHARLAVDNDLEVRYLSLVLQGAEAPALIADAPTNRATLRELAAVSDAIENVLEARRQQREAEEAAAETRALDDAQLAALAGELGLPADARAPGEDPDLAATGAAVAPDPLAAPAAAHPANAEAPHAAPA